MLSPEELPTTFLAVPQLQARSDKARYNDERVLGLQPLLPQFESQLCVIFVFKHVEFGEAIRKLKTALVHQ